MDDTEDDEAASGSDFDALGSPGFDDMFETTTEEQIERAIRTARAKFYLEDEDAAAARLYQARIERLEREEGARARERNQLSGAESATTEHTETVQTVQDQETCENIESDEVAAILSQTPEEDAAKKAPFPGRPRPAQRTVVNDMARARAEEAEKEREDELAWTEANNVQWVRRRYQPDKSAQKSATRDTAGVTMDADRAAVVRNIRPEGLRNTKNRLRPGNGSRPSSGQFLEAPMQPRSLLKTAWIDPDPEGLAKSGQRVRLLRASPPQPKQWRIPGRRRGRMNMNMDRIYTEYILADAFVHDINEMLDSIHNWPREDASEIMQFFQEDPENEGRRIIFHVVLKDESRHWTVRIETPNPSIYHPRIYAHSHRLPPGQRPTRIDWGPAAYGKLPQSCIRNGCSQGCPRQRRRADDERSLIKGRNIQRSEKALIKLGCIKDPSTGALTTSFLQKLDRMVMPPPPLPIRRLSSSGQRNRVGPGPLPLSAANVSKLPDATMIPPPSPRPQRRELNLNDDQQRMLALVSPSRRTTLSPTITPEPEAIPQPKYTSASDITKFKKRFYAKCLPQSATQVSAPMAAEMKALPAPEPSEPSTSDKNKEILRQALTKVFKKPPKHPKKKHQEIEAWQIDPDRH